MSWDAIEAPMTPAPITTTCGPTISCRDRASAAITSIVRLVSVLSSTLHQIWHTCWSVTQALDCGLQIGRQVGTRLSRRWARVSNQNARNTNHAKHATHSAQGWDLPWNFPVLALSDVQNRRRISAMGDSAVASESRLFVGTPLLAEHCLSPERLHTHTSCLAVSNQLHPYAALTPAASSGAGQIPSGTREEQLWGLFSPYGTIRNLHLLKGFDSKPRGCAMVLFARWSQAEAAAEALNGKTGQLVGQTRPLVVHFANPRRSPQGPPEPGIAPRKLFVGQVQPIERRCPHSDCRSSTTCFARYSGPVWLVWLWRPRLGSSACCGCVVSYNPLQPCRHGVVGQISHIHHVADCCRPRPVWFSTAPRLGMLESLHGSVPT